MDYKLEILIQKTVLEETVSFIREKFIKGETPTNDFEDGRQAAFEAVVEHLEETICELDKDMKE